MSKNDKINLPELIYCDTCKKEKKWIRYERIVEEGPLQKHEVFVLSCGHRVLIQK